MGYTIKMEILFKFLLVHKPFNNLILFLISDTD